VRFMYNSIAESERVLLICSEKYVTKSVSGLGGVGYEGLIVSADVAQDIDTKKFIPLIRDNTSKTKVPRFLGARLSIDFSDDLNYKIKLEELLRELLGSPAAAKPPLGRSPFLSNIPSRDTSSLTEPTQRGMNSFLHCCLLLHEALAAAYSGSAAGG